MAACSVLKPGLATLTKNRGASQVKTEVVVVELEEVLVTDVVGLVVDDDELEE